MPIYRRQCKKCEHAEDYYARVEDRDISGKCPLCKGSMKRVIALESVNCANDDSVWVRSCAEVLCNKNDRTPEVVAFRNNPTRSNLNALMQAKGLRHVERGEHHGGPEDRPEHEQRREYEAEKNRVMKGMLERRLERERIHVRGL
jgi:putative FmdB family regulatory protein